MVGLPYDGTCSYRPGARFGPELIRIASYGLESYSPIQERDLDDVKFYDAGEIEFQLGNREDSLQKIETAAEETLLHNKKWLGVGGEHLVTFPAIKAYSKKYPELYVIHFDAHADVREDYIEEKLSHACVMRRISEIITPDNLIQIGIRSGTQEEFEWMKENNTIAKTQEEFKERLKFPENKPVFLSVDLDVLDPSLMSGTGTPEPGGMTYNELMSWLMLLKNLNIVGADVVELSPHYDQSGVSTVTAAKVIREVLLLMN
ncbi:MAG TPA: agmatinase [Cyanobacteria bacterium UBA9971]|nr:agmatinase [Cyanobacteria bacterium UBA9971]